VAAQNIIVVLTDNSYGAAIVTNSIGAGQKRTIVLNLDKSHGWYDFTVRVEGIACAVHFAGHVETTYASFTDPLMGGMLSA
jgi:phospholipase C